MSSPWGGSGLHAPASFHQTSQGTATRSKGSRAWQHLAVVAAARLKEDLSVFLVYKQSQGVCSLPAKGVQPVLEQSHLDSRLRCSRPGKLPGPEEVMHGVQGGVFATLVSLWRNSFQSTLPPPKPFLPRAPSCPEAGPGMGLWGAAKSVPPPSLQGTDGTCATPIPCSGTQQHSGAGPVFLPPSNLAQNAVSEPNPSGSRGARGSAQIMLYTQGCRARLEQQESPYLKHNFS